MKLVPLIVLACAAAPAVAEDVFFQSPSGNIHCIMSDDPNFGGTRCDIMEVNALSYASRPADCDLDWGQAFFVGPSGGAGPICHGDTAAAGGPVLDYGMSYTLGGVTCFSETSGMLCRNEEGAGFALSRSEQQAF